jgi:hypothetical protein
MIEAAVFYYGYVPIMLALIGALTCRCRMDKEESNIDRIIHVLLVLCSIGFAWFIWSVVTAVML